MLQFKAAHARCFGLRVHHILPLLQTALPCMGMALGLLLFLFLAIVLLAGKGQTNVMK